MITLNEQEINGLQAFLNDVPFRYSAPIIQLLSEKIQKVKQEQQEESSENPLKKAE